MNRVGNSAGRSWDDYMRTSLQDREEAAAYLEAAKAEGDAEVLEIALRRVAEAQEAARLKEA